MSSTHTKVDQAVARLCNEVGATTRTVNQADLMLYRHCREGRGAAPALYFKGATFTYSQIADEATRCADWLRSFQVVPGDRVVVVLPDCPTLVAAYFGIAAVGAIAILLDPGLPAEDSLYIIQHCAPRAVIAQEVTLSRLVGLRSIVGGAALVGADPDWTLPSDLADALRARSRAPCPDFPASPDGYVYGLLSSGSTGRPKLIVHRHRDILHAYCTFGLMHGLCADDRVVSVPKMTTGYGLGCSLLMPFLAGASTALVPETPGAAVMVEAIENWRCTVLFAQPRLLAAVMATRPPGQALRSLRLVITGGEPLATSLIERWARFSAVELLDSYGSTELGFLYISNRVGMAQKGSVGRAVEGVHIEIVDDDMKRVEAGRIGKLRVRGPMMIDGYWNDPVRSSQSFKDGWFVTSDLFSVNDDGFYCIHGRSDHMIKLGCGDWVNPVELEGALLEHPRVRECAVVGAANMEGLTLLKAFVVIDGPAAPDQALAADIARSVRDRWPLQEFKRIARVQFTQALPKTTAGKLDRARLKSQSMTEFSYKC